MKRILYLSIVDWNWIKQRPQMIAEELAKSNEVYCIYPVYHKKNELADNSVKLEKLHLLPRFKIPFSGRSSFIKTLDNIYQHFVVAFSIVKYKPDVVYVSFPTDYSFLLKKLAKTVVYDCIDNHPEFEKTEKAKRRMRREEKKLIDMSACTFVSSEYLKNVIIKNYGTPENRIVLVRNGYSGEIIKIESVAKIRNTKIRVAYIGTVSSWFDFNIISSITEKNDDVEFHIFGPVNVERPDIKNVFFRGVVNHSELFETIKEFDALIMPFVINEIIEAVDPVKLYEYINFNKPIISVYYEEIKRFEKFVWFYSDVESLMECLNKVKTGEVKYANEERIAFLNNNNWINRVKTIEEFI